MKYATVIFLSWHQTDANGEHNVVAVKDRFAIQTRELKSFKEEADSGMISHISEAGKKWNDICFVKGHWHCYLQLSIS